MLRFVVAFAIELCLTALCSIVLPAIVCLLQPALYLMDGPSNSNEPGAETGVGDIPDPQSAPEETSQTLGETLDLIEVSSANSANSDDTTTASFNSVDSIPQSVVTELETQPVLTNVTLLTTVNCGIDDSVSVHAECGSPRGQIDVTREFLRTPVCVEHQML